MGQEESHMLNDSTPPETLTARTLDAVAEYIKSGKVRRIVVLTGAGISTAAGIPDFRSPKTGLYANLARLKLPYAEAVFDISYFRNNPDPFYILAKELYPGKFHPTVSHAFISLLAKKGLLHTLFTQNIDCLERRAGVPADKIIEAHGSFATQRCIECKEEFDGKLMEECVISGKVPRCEQEGCNGLVKPDIVFFGEALPQAFRDRSHQTAMADIVLILGTSLTVYPFAGLPDLTQAGKPRVLFNMEQVGSIGSRSDDVLALGPCDAMVRKLADALGWRDELETLWREIVGEKEAERQLATQEEHDEEVGEEVDELAAKVERALNLRLDKAETTEPEKPGSPHATESTESTTAPGGGKPETPKTDAERKEDESASAPTAKEDKLDTTKESLPTDEAAQEFKADEPLGYHPKETEAKPAL